MDDIRHIKCVILGEANVGKTSLITRYLHDKFYQFSESTIGCAFNNKRYNRNNKEYKLDMWDTAGQERYRAIMPMYYRNADIAFFCIDLSIKNLNSSFNYWKKQLKTYNDNKNRIICIVGTKSDIKLERTLDELKKDLGDNFNCQYFETSSKDNKNVKLMFESMINQTIDNYEKNNPIDQKYINLKTKKSIIYCC